MKRYEMRADGTFLFAIECPNHIEGIAMSNLGGLATLVGKAIEDGATMTVKQSDGGEIAGYKEGWLDRAVVLLQYVMDPTVNAEADGEWVDDCSALLDELNGCGYFEDKA